MPYTISQLAKKFGLSRSSLLYYDAIGILRPKSRSRSNYRVYSDKDLVMLGEIAQLRNAGIPLGTIKTILQSRPSRRNGALRERLQHINKEINSLRGQQRLILKLLGQKELMHSTRVLTKEKWIGFLAQAGLNRSGMERWHVEFELSAPEAHQDFLESLGLAEEEIKMIREHSRTEKR